MNNYCRSLLTNVEVERFVEGVMCIEDDEDAVVEKIAAAERNMSNYKYYSTLDRYENRNFRFRDDHKRQELRKKIIDELFEQHILEDDESIRLGIGGAKPDVDSIGCGEAFYLIGPPASGKSKIASIISKKYGCYLLDSDYAKRKLPEFKAQIGAASLVHDESDVIVFGDNGLMDKCLDKHYSLVIPKIGHNIDSIIQFCDRLKKVGYKVYLISADLDRQKATQRAYNRFARTNRYVPLSLVFDAYGNQPMLNYFRLKQKHTSLFDGFAQINTDVDLNSPFQLEESIGIQDFGMIDWR